MNAPRPPFVPGRWTPICVPSAAKSVETPSQDRIVVDEAEISLFTFHFPRDAGEILPRRKEL